MLEQGGHWGRHYQTPRAHTITMGPLARIRAALTRGAREEGRRRILPGKPPENHASGWQPAAYPNKKAPAAAATADQGDRTKSIVIIPQRTEKSKGGRENA